jgi:hypothetical protein
MPPVIRMASVIASYEHGYRTAAFNDRLRETRHFTKPHKARVNTAAQKETGKIAKSSAIEYDTCSFVVPSFVLPSPLMLLLHLLALGPVAVSFTHNARAILVAITTVFRE